MSRRVLVVDDDEMNRELLGRILSSDYDVLEAENGKKALEILNAEHKSISAILLDIVMPEMDGYEVLVRMKNEPVLAAVPVIVTTGDTQQGAEVKALSLGAQDYVAKPYNPEVIKRRLWNTINLRETAAIANAAVKDDLTGLYNRKAFFERAAQAVAGHAPGYYVVASFNINNFKMINDQYGAAKGDWVLRFVADVFRKGFDAAGGLCCRVMADNFAVLYPRSFMDSKEINEIRQRAARLDGSMLPLTFSIGRCIADDLSLSISAMYDRATMAENLIKGRYDIHVAFYDESMRRQLMEEQEIVNEMNGALESRQFEVWFQPQYNHSTGALIGSEALVRWRHPKKGLVPPGKFIPVFERNGFIYELDKYVWERVCELLRRWIDEGRSPLPVSVNISRYDVFRDDLIDVISSLIEKYRLPVSLLRLEITESAFAKSPDQIIRVVRLLTERHFTVEIDDFGSGYSSLNTLKDVPADVLKLDMRFLESSENSTRGGNILESVVRMSKWLGMSVIAEGVETKEQADYLKTIGCNYVQGYLYARPMPAQDFEELAKKAGKEEKMLALETVENFNNNSFWDPKSMDTLVFNCYVGGACIFEYFDGKIDLLRANDKFVKMLGVKDDVSLKQIMQLHWAEHLTPESAAALKNAIDKSIEGHDEANCEVAFIKLPGGIGSMHFSVSVRVIAVAGNRILVYTIAENITKQRAAEQEAHQTAERLQAIMDNVGSGVTASIISVSDVQFLFSNDKFYNLLGYTREQYAQEISDPFAVIYEKDRAMVRETISEVNRTQKSAVCDYRVVRRDKKVRWVRSIVSIARFGGVDTAIQLAVTTDVTAEKEAEERYRENDAQLRLLNETAHELLSNSDVSDGVTGVLRRVMNYFGGSRASVIELDYRKGTASVTYEVCAPGVQGKKEALSGVPIGTFHSWNISPTTIPRWKEGRLAGYVSVDAPTQNELQLDQLKAIGDYITSTLVRRDLIARIERAGTVPQ